MTGEITPSQPVQEHAELDSPSVRLAAGVAAEAYQLDYFREYPRGNSKPSGGERLRLWQKAEDESPQFAEQIAALGSVITDAQQATEIAGSSLATYFYEVANPITRELLANILIIRLGAHKIPFQARKIVASLGVNEKDEMISILNKYRDSFRLLSTTDVMEAYLKGDLSIHSAASLIKPDAQEHPSV